MRATDRTKGQHARRRVLYAVLGLVLIATGVAVFLTQPERGELVALFLVGIGGGFIDPGTVIGVIRAIRSGSSWGGGYGDDDYRGGGEPPVMP